jgi:hypothetical protein
MMGGWIDEVQIGYVGGKHDMNQLCFSFMWISNDEVHEPAFDDIITGREHLHHNNYRGFTYAACGYSLHLHNRI